MSQKYLEQYQQWLDTKDPLLESNEYEATLIFGSSDVDSVSGVAIPVI